MEYKYIKEPYRKELRTNVKNVDDKKVELEETIFYPRGGGQLGDKGEIINNGEKIKIEKVRKKNGKILHYVGETKNLEEGEEIDCKLDWERRYKMMRSHTAAHIVSTVVNNETGAKITGNSLGLDKIRIDFSLENFNRDRLKQYVNKANKIINKELPVEDYIITREELEKREDMVQLAKGLPSHIKNVRIVKIGEFNEQPDGGLHVKNTKEIGKIKLIDCKNKGKNNRRIYIKLED